MTKQAYDQLVEMRANLGEVIKDPTTGLIGQLIDVLLEDADVQRGIAEHTSLYQPNV